MQGGRDRPGGQLSVEHIATVTMLQEAAFKDRLCQFLNEEGHAVSPVKQLVDDGLWQRLASRNAFDQRDAVQTAQPAQMDGGYVRMARPRRDEFRTRGDQK